MVLKASELQRSQPDLVDRLWTACAEATYSLEQRVRQLGLGDEVRGATIGGGAKSSHC